MLICTNRTVNVVRQFVQKEERVVTITDIAKCKQEAGGALAIGHRGGDVGERLVGVGADRANRHQADDDDQRQHHGILDGRGAIF